MNVAIEKCKDYSVDIITAILKSWEPLFSSIIKKGDRVLLKPNWISPSHKYNKKEWLSVITHPDVITSVLNVVLDHLDHEGSVTIADAPQTDSSWGEIMDRMEPERWVMIGKKAGVEVQIIDLRDHEWTLEDGIVVNRKQLSGDPRGSTECDLQGYSEFDQHIPSQKGYYGADYNIEETNQVHRNNRHKYKVSRSVIESDVFINLPKMKTHKKAGITCSLKNLVGINTYKNWLPHFTIGTPDKGGDQFDISSIKNKSETVILEKIKKYVSQNVKKSRWLIPLMKLGKGLFGDTTDTIRSGNWYGNDTLWRMIFDLNKILFYADSNGNLRINRPDNRKKYISIVDGIVAGEGNGPEAPDPIKANVIVGGNNPVAVDLVCARLMGFDWRKIPSLSYAFSIKDYSFCDFVYEDIILFSSNDCYKGRLSDLPLDIGFRFNPHFGWKGHIEI